MIPLVCAQYSRLEKKNTCVPYTARTRVVPTCTGRVPRYYYEGTTCTTFVGSSTDDIRRMYMYVENRYMQSKFNVYTTTLQKSRINSILLDTILTIYYLLSTKLLVVECTSWQMTVLKSPYVYHFSLLCSRSTNIAPMASNNAPRGK